MNEREALKNAFMMKVRDAAVAELPDPPGVQLHTSAVDKHGVPLFKAELAGRHRRTFTRTFRIPFRNNIKL
jgi:hypothetical protein